jgi:hypothetical protein
MTSSLAMPSRFFRQFGLCVFLLLALSACAVGRSALDIKSPQAANPADSRTLAKVTEVRDLRHFTTTAPDPSQHTLGSADDIRNATVTGRAIGRKRNGFGAALGDLTLPEGMTVSSLVKAAATAALQQRGYRVVEEGSAEAARAFPVAIDVDQFWAWINIGFTELTMTHASKVVLKSNDLVQPSPKLVDARHEIKAVVGTESNWAITVNGGVSELVQQIQANIKAPSELTRSAPQANAGPLLPGT